MEGPFKFCLGPLEIQMVGAPDPQQKMSVLRALYQLNLFCQIPVCLLATNILPGTFIEFWSLSMGFALQLVLVFQ